jgi:hypothetical protein
MTAEIGVSPSTYRSYEKNTPRPSVNVFSLWAQSLGFEVEEFLPLYASTVIFALQPALERELALQNGTSGADGTTYVQHEVPSDSGSNDDDDYENPAPGLDGEKDESFTYVRDDATIRSPPSDDLAKFDDDAFFEDGVLEEEDDHDNEEEEAEEVSAFSAGDFIAPRWTFLSSLRHGTRKGARS